MVKVYIPLATTDVIKLTGSGESCGLRKRVNFRTIREYITVHGLILETDISPWIVPKLINPIEGVHGRLTNLPWKGRKSGSVLGRAHGNQKGSGSDIPLTIAGRVN